jgi:hypothetical protein
VGPNLREFTIHSALFSHQSPVLEKLVNGNFSEAAEKSVTWKSVDEDTFIKFWEYTYTGKYTADRTIIGLKSEPEAAQKSEEQAALKAERVVREAEEEEMSQLLKDQDNMFVGLSSQQEQRLSELQANVMKRVVQEATKRVVIAAEEKELEELLRKRNRKGKLSKKDDERLAHLREKTAWRRGEQAARDDTLSKNLTKRETQWNIFKHHRASAAVLDVTLEAENPPQEDYTNIFLSHARLYVFAECYGITGLMELSLNELHSTLVTFTLHDERVNDIVALVSYCYENLVPESLREIVALYAACKVEKLWPSEEFQALVETHGELSRSLIGSMVKVV